MPDLGGLWTGFVNNPVVQFAARGTLLYVGMLYLATVFWTIRDAQQRTENRIMPYLAGFLVRGDEGMGVIGHIVLGIVGALVGGFLAGVLFHTNPIDGPLDVSSIVTAVIGAVIVVVGWNALTGRTRAGRGMV